MRLLPLLGLLLAGAVPAAAQDAPGLSLVDAWIRELAPGLPAAGYFTLRNDSGATVQLVGASSPDCGSLTLHQTIREHAMSAMSGLDPGNAREGMGAMPGMTTMRPVAAVPVPGHGAVRFAPGGYHLMCEHPTPAVQAGRSVAVTLRFAGGRSLRAAFPVRSPRGG